MYRQKDKDKDYDADQDKDKEKDETIASALAAIEEYRNRGQVSPQHSQHPTPSELKALEERREAEEKEQQQKELKDKNKDIKLEDKISEKHEIISEDKNMPVSITQDTEEESKEIKTKIQEQEAIVKAAVKNSDKSNENLTLEATNNLVAETNRVVAAQLSEVAAKLSEVADEMCQVAIKRSKAKNPNSKDED